MKVEYEGIYSKLNDSLKNLSHAYLFVINDNIDSKEIIFSFIKNIFTKDESDENKAKIISSIDNNTFSELREITADGLWIKKEQMNSLKDEFKTKVLNANKRIYIINDADKLNQSSSNSILKFLEEPEDDIIAILTTNNLGGVLSTIVSRCQIINLPKTDTKNLKLEEKLFFLFKNNMNIEDYKKNDYGANLINKVVDFVIKLENQKSKMICFSKTYFHNNFKTREEIEIVFQIILLFYKDVLGIKNNKPPKYFIDYQKNISEIANNNSINSIIDKINILIEKKELIKNNISVNLLIDSLIFEFEGEKL